MENSESESSISESKAADGGDNKFQVLLNDLLPLWQAHHVGGLELRHATGKRLNHEYGQPDERQEYGKATLKKLSQALSVAESDLYRMRTFASRFESVKALNAEYPDATTWTKVKELIVQPKHPQAVPVAQVIGDLLEPVTERPVAQMLGEVRTLRRSARTVGKLPPDGEDWKVMNEAVKRMLSAVGACLGGRFTFVPSATPSQSVTVQLKPVAEPSRSMDLNSPSSEALATVGCAAGNGQSDSF